VSTETPITQSENQGRVIALDPGVRTFLTYFTPDELGKLGDRDFGRIQRLCFFLDDLISRQSSAKPQAKRRMKKAEKRLRLKIKNLIKEAHHQIANWLTTNFDIILLPTFETSQMSTKAKRKLNKKSVRAMLTWSHYSFQQFLLHKAKERNKTVLLVNEAYTSKTVSWTGEIDHKLGGKKRIVSKSTDTWMDRDINGARGIFLRALVDTPFLEPFKNAFINAC
jgi:putative transposase